MLIQQMLKQTQAKLEQAQIAMVSLMNDCYPAIPLDHGAEKNDPDVMYASLRD